jgi:hypothetical protein
MRKFLINSAFFLACGALLFHVKPLWLMYKDRYKAVVSGDEIYFALKKSKSKNKNKKVLFGDSVGRQLFDCKKEHDSLNSLASNQSISMAGQYILFRQYLEAGNEVDTAYFLMRPFTFKNNLDQVYSYHYFLKPFYNDEYRPFLTETVIHQVEKLPYYRFCRYPPILTSNWAPDFHPPDSTAFTFLSPVSVEYLKKIKALAAEKKVSLVFLPTPVSDEYLNELAHIQKTEINNNGLEDIFSGYFEKINLLPDSLFSDHSHLVHPEEYSSFYRKNYLNL